MTDQDGKPFTEDRIDRIRSRLRNWRLRMFGTGWVHLAKDARETLDLLDAQSARIAALEADLANVKQQVGAPRRVQLVLPDLGGSLSDLEIASGREMSARHVETFGHDDD